MSEQKQITFKGFDGNLRCRDFQFEVGKTYTVSGEIKACHNGFHSCPDHPFDVWEFYPPSIDGVMSRFGECEIGGESHREDRKIASAEITVKAELTLPQFIERGISLLLSRLDFSKAPASNSGVSGAASNSGDSGAASNSGDIGAASNSGYRGAASNSGDRGAASNSGYSGAASNSGDRGAASNSGDRGAASNSGDRGAASNSGVSGAASNSGYIGAASNSGYRGAALNSGVSGAASNSGYRGAALNSGVSGAASNSGDRGAAITTGQNSCAADFSGTGTVQGELGCALFAVERDGDGRIIHAKSAVVGIDGIEANRPYRVRVGKWVATRGAQ